MTNDEWWEKFDPEFYRVDQIDELADQPDENIWTKFEDEDVELVTLKAGRHPGGDDYYHSATPWSSDHLGLVIVTDFRKDYGPEVPPPGACLSDCWVVILTDPDGNDWSPWSVTATDQRQAILKAQSNWRRWCQVHAAADVVKVYRDSWIGQIV